MSRLGLAALLLSVACAVSSAGPKAEKPKPGSIRGKYLTPGGKPLVGGTVRVFDQNAKPLPCKPSELPGPVAEIKTDRDGKFRADNIPPGTYWFSISHPTRSRGVFLIGAVKPFKLKPGQAYDGSTVKSEAKDLRPNFLKDR
jgi:hypothetical protein